MASPSKSRKQGRYHHGDLPRALVEAALALVEDQGVSALTLREVARRVGVTHAAPYRHFKDKSALLAAVAEEGFKRLTHALVAARGAAPAAEGRAAMGIAYLRFAIEHPAHYRVMFGVEAETARTDGLRAAAAELFTEVQQSSPAPSPAASPDGAGQNLAATSAWAEWHGLAALHLGGWLAQPVTPPVPQLLARAIAAAASPARRSAATSAARPSDRATATPGAPSAGTPSPGPESVAPADDPAEPTASAPDGGARQTTFDS
ncbi:MAG: WHG domain-containing protein [Deltaproteobacteria bacterium]|nr:WHG domain-containing protein [Deltaproteobacteria bacterium]